MGTKNLPHWSDKLWFALALLLLPLAILLDVVQNACNEEDDRLAEMPAIIRAAYRMSIFFTGLLIVVFGVHFGAEIWKQHHLTSVALWLFALFGLTLAIRSVVKLAQNE